MRHITVGALALVVLGALWLSASSTLELGERHRVPAAALPALVVVLEVASVIGTALWVTAGPNGRRAKPAAVVLLASSVAGVGGWQAYGWLGLVAPLAVVVVTDMVAERWTDLGRTTVADPAGTDPGPATGPATDGEGAPAERSPESDAADEPAEAPDRGGPAPDRPPGTGPVTDDEVLADLQRRGEVDPSPRSLRTRYGMRHDRAARLVAEHADRADRSAPAEVGTGGAP